MLLWFSLLPSNPFSFKGIITLVTTFQVELKLYLFQLTTYSKQGELYTVKRESIAASPELKVIRISPLPIFIKLFLYPNLNSDL